MNRTIREAFATLQKIKPNMKILHLTHTDMDGEGPAILLRLIFGTENIDVKHCSNNSMSFDIGTTVQNDAVMNQYDLVIATDISCNEMTEGFINRSRNVNKFILLDHHASAQFLNRNKWACVEPYVLADSYRANDYANYAPYKGHSSGTSLMYDYLEYCDMFSTLTDDALNTVKEFVRMVVAYDTWEWDEIFHREPRYEQLDKLFELYGSEIFTKRILQKISNHNLSFDKTDNLMLEIDKSKSEAYVANLESKFSTGNMKLPDGTYASIVYVGATDYLQDVFERMKTLYPDVDLYIVSYGSGISVRTIKPEYDLSRFLAQFGGGGHPGAGGISIPFQKRIDLVAEAFHSAIYLDRNNQSLSQ